MQCTRIVKFSFNSDTSGVYESGCVCEEGMRAHMEEEKLIKSPHATLFTIQSIRQFRL